MMGMNFGMGEIIVIMALFVALILFILFFAGTRNASATKRKREPLDSRPDWLAGMSAREKPKRDAHYTIGDDGELVEVHEDILHDSPHQEHKA